MNESIEEIYHKALLEIFLKGGYLFKDNVASELSEIARQALLKGKELEPDRVSHKPA